MSGFSPTRAHRWPCFWAGWPRPRRQTTPSPAASRPGTWPRCCAPPAPRRPPDTPPPRRPAAVPPGLPEPLTDRETDVLQLIAAGKPNQQIAQELVITIDTVKKHVTHLLGKLGAANRTEAVTRAHQ